MKVKELLAQMESENPDAEVLPARDEFGEVTLTVRRPENSFGEPLTNNQEAKKILGAHVHRIENIRAAICAFFGLAVNVKIHASPTAPHFEWIEFRVKSPTGKTMMTAELSVSYVLKKSDGGWERPYVGNGSPEHRRRFYEAEPELSGYRCYVHEYEQTRSKINEALQKFTEAPKWNEVVRERERDY